MMVPSIFLAYILASNNPQPSQIEEGKVRNLELEEYGRKETGGIAIKHGISWGDERKYTSTSAALLIESYLAEFRLRKEDAPLERIEDSIKIIGITLTGKRAYRAYLADFTFGIEFLERARKWYDLKLYGQVTGGFQVVKNNLFIEGERIPGDPDVAFFAGGGTRGEIVFRIPKIKGYFISMGIGGITEYLKETDEFVQQSINSINYGFYGILRLSREKERTELRIKKE